MRMVKEKRREPVNSQSAIVKFALILACPCVVSKGWMFQYPSRNPLMAEEKGFTD